MNKKKILIIGAGYGGVHAAKILNKKFKKDDAIEITLVDKKPYHTLLTELHEVAGARVEQESVMVDLVKILGATKVNVVTDTVTGADLSNRIVTSEASIYGYDYLILGLGSEPADFGIPGVKENAFTIWSKDDAVKIREHIKEMFKIASIEKNAEKRRELLTFVVAGAGFTGVETIGEIAEWKRRLCREYYIDEKEVRLILIEALDKILAILNEVSIKKAERKLQKLKVEIMTSAPITSIEKDFITLKNNTSIKTHTLIWTAGIQGNKSANNLYSETVSRNRIETNNFMQSTKYENIYAIGDINYFIEKDRPLPQIVETALQTAEAAAHNIIADIENKPKRAFKSNYHGIMVSIGSRYAVAELMGVKLSGFIALAMKHLINVHYLFGVAGINAVWSYIKHEFFDVRDNRSVIGGHAAIKTPTFWIAILRIYIGILWLLEGIGKIKEGWLVPGNIHIIVTGTSSGVPQKAADGVTSATQVVGTGTQAATTYPVPLLSKPPALYQWFTDVFIKPHAFIFQVMVVLLEIGIGLALIAGLLTVLASLGSIFLSMNFILSGVADKSIFWYMVGGLVLCGGAGRALGLDYYVMPWLKHWWNGTQFAKKTYLYIGKPNFRVK